MYLLKTRRNQYGEASDLKLSSEWVGREIYYENKLIGSPQKNTEVRSECFSLHTCRVDTIKLNTAGVFNFPSRAKFS